MKVKFVTKVEEAKASPVLIYLEQDDKGVAMMHEDGYYICTLQNDGKLMLHASPHGAGINVDAKGYIKVVKE